MDPSLLTNVRELPVPSDLPRDPFWFARFTGDFYDANGANLGPIVMPIIPEECFLVGAAIEAAARQERGGSDGSVLGEDDDVQTNVENPTHPNADFLGKNDDVQPTIETSDDDSSYEDESQNESDNGQKSSGKPPPRHGAARRATTPPISSLHSSSREAPASAHQDPSGDGEFYSSIAERRKMMRRSSQPGRNKRSYLEEEEDEDEELTPVHVSKKLKTQASERATSVESSNSSSDFTPARKTLPSKKRNRDDYEDSQTLEKAVPGSKKQKKKPVGENEIADDIQTPSKKNDRDDDDDDDDDDETPSPVESSNTSDYTPARKTAPSKKNDRDNDDDDDDDDETPSPVESSNTSDYTPARKTVPSKKNDRDEDDGTQTSKKTVPGSKTQKKPVGKNEIAVDINAVATKPVAKRPPKIDLPPMPEYDESQVGGSGWSQFENDALYYCMVERRNREIDENLVPLKDTNLFKLMAQNLQAYFSIERPPNGCKNQWNRKLRELYGYDERGTGKTEATSSQTKNRK